MLGTANNPQQAASIPSALITAMTASSGRLAAVLREQRVIAAELCRLQDPFSKKSRSCLCILEVVVTLTEEGHSP